MKLIDIIAELLALLLILLMSGWLIYRIIAPDMVNTVGAMDWTSCIGIGLLALLIIKEFVAGRRSVK